MVELFTIVFWFIPVGVFAAWVGWNFLQGILTLRRR